MTCKKSWKYFVKSHVLKDKQIVNVDKKLIHYQSDLVFKGIFYVISSPRNQTNWQF